MKKIILTLIAICLCVMASEAKTKVQYKGNLTFGSSFGTATTDIGGVKRTSNKAIFTPEFETVHGALFGKNFFLKLGFAF